MMTDKEMKAALLRRELLGGSATLPLLVGRSADAAAPPALPHAATEAQAVLHINGRDHALVIDPRTTLLDVLRERIGLTGSKKGCDHGQCGACTVHVDGRRVLSCLTLALSAQGHAVTTIEGLSHADGSLHPMQQAFIDHDAFQCGYCTPGQIMSAAALIAEGHAGSAAEIREWMSGNICRCGAYPNIVAAVQDVAGQQAATTGTAKTGSEAL